MKEKKIARSFDVTTVLYTPVLDDGSLGESATTTFPAILTQRRYRSFARRSSGCYWNQG